MKGQKWLFLASWVLLLVLCAVIGFYSSLVSLGRAYFGNQDLLTTVEMDGRTKAIGLEQIREIGGEEAVKAFKGRRVTAAVWAIGYALLAIFVVLFPYRRGEKWAWFALLISIGLPQLASIGRVFILGSFLGAQPSLTVLAVTLLALLAGAPHIFAKPTIEDYEEVK
jgi:hypothetical protein